MRVYPRKFSWEEARELRAQGMTYQAIADDFGVSMHAVILATNDKLREKQYKRTSELQKTGGRCLDCGITISRNPSAPAKRCRTCAGIARRYVSLDIRGDDALCHKCKRWLGLLHFPPSRKHNRHRECTECDNKRKSSYRARKAIEAANSDGWNDASGTTWLEREMLEGTAFEVRAEW